MPFAVALTESRCYLGLVTGAPYPGSQGLSLHVIVMGRAAEPGSSRSHTVHVCVTTVGTEG